MIQIFSKLLDWWFRDWGFIFLAVGEEKAFLMGNDKRREPLVALVHNCLKEDDSWFRDIILEGAEKYFKEREIDTKNFIEKIK